MFNKKPSFLHLLSPHSPMKWYISYSKTIGLCSIHTINGRQEAGLEMTKRTTGTLRWPIIHSPPALALLWKWPMAAGLYILRPIPSTCLLNNGYRALSFNLKYYFSTIFVCKLISYYTTIQLVLFVIEKFRDKREGER